MSEQVFFEYDGVKVTNSRFIVDGQTYAMGNITSVTPTEKKPNRLPPIGLLLLGLVVFFQTSFSYGFMLIAVAALWLYLQKTTFHIILHTAGAETSALKSHQREYVTKVVGALNSAIVARG